jgi:hypothetical protein
MGGFGLIKLTQGHRNFLQWCKDTKSEGEINIGCYMSAMIRNVLLRGSYYENDAEAYNVLRKKHIDEYNIWKK